MENDEKLNPLTSEAKYWINKYLYRRLIPTGVIAGLISFVFGFLVNEVARSKAHEKAYTEAISSFSGKISETAEKIGASKNVVAQASAQAAASSEEISAIVDSIRITKIKYDEYLKASDPVKQIRAILKSDNEVRKTLFDQVSSDIRTIKSVKVVSKKVTGTSSLKAEVACPKNMIAISGGAEILRSGNNSFLTQNAPILSSGNPIGWKASEYLVTPEFTHDIVVYCVCSSFN